jgi:hypothetical protein
MGCGSSGLEAGLEVEDAGDDADGGVVGLVTAKVCVLAI